MDEFSLIKRYFTRTAQDVSAILGVGDDAAVWRPRGDCDLAVAADMLLVDRHFFADDDPYDIGYKALSVNVSDMAAMGASPRAATLCLALPEIDPVWLDAFARGFWAVADRFGIDLVGGDTTCGPLAIAIQMWGELPRGRGLFRHAAREGDDIWVSGQLGGAALGLQYRQGKLQLDSDLARRCLHRLHRPEARVLLGASLLDLAHAAIDVSDGLLADLGHILQASGCGARLVYSRLPLDMQLNTQRNEAWMRDAVLAGGDDYELCFTAPQVNRESIESLAQHLDVPLSRIGEIEMGSGIIIQGENGEQLLFKRAGYNHFSTTDT